MYSEDKNSIQAKQANIEQVGSISTFVIKIYNLLNQPHNAQGICWHDDGKSFIIKNPTILTNYILPRYFRHNNYQSFIRQLNMYNFAKQKDYASHRFANKYFIKDREQLLRFIKRKPEKKKRKNSDESLESQKQNGSNSQIVSIKQIEAQEIVSEKNINGNNMKAEEPLVGFVSVKKKVCFHQAILQKSQQNISTIMEATSKWINSKDQSCWVNIKSFKSIDLSMRLIENQEEINEEREISQHFSKEGQRPLQNNLILLFNPNISENNIRQLQN